MLRWLGRQLKLLAGLFVITLLAALADEIPPLQALHAQLEENPQPWLGLCIAAAASGFALLTVVWASALFGKPNRAKARPRPRARGSQRPPPQAMRSISYRGASFAQVKWAFRGGEWLSNPAIRPYCVGLIGALLATCGLFGTFIVIGPPSAQLACALALAYALTRTAWGFWRA